MDRNRSLFNHQKEEEKYDKFLFKCVSVYHICFSLRMKKKYGRLLYTVHSYTRYSFLIFREFSLCVNAQHSHRCILWRGNRNESLSGDDTDNWWRHSFTRLYFTFAIVFHFLFWRLLFLFFFYFYFAFVFMGIFVAMIESNVYAGFITRLQAIFRLRACVQYKFHVIVLYHIQNIGVARASFVCDCETFAHF